MATFAPWFPLIAAAISALAAIMGGLIVATFNHYFQARREFVKNRQEKLENIVLRTITLTSFCKKLNNRSVNIKSIDEALNFSEYITSGDDRNTLKAIRIEIASLVMIYYNSSYDLATDLANLANRFIADIRDYSQLGLFSLE